MGYLIVRNLDIRMLFLAGSKKN